MDLLALRIVALSMTVALARELVPDAIVVVVFRLPRPTATRLRRAAYLLRD